MHLILLNNIKQDVVFVAVSCRSTQYYVVTSLLCDPRTETRPNEETKVSPADFLQHETQAYGSLLCVLIIQKSAKHIAAQKDFLSVHICI